MLLLRMVVMLVMMVAILAMAAMIWELISPCVQCLHPADSKTHVFGSVALWMRFCVATHAGMEVSMKTHGLGLAGCAGMGGLPSKNGVLQPCSDGRLFV
mmetsp:Transcript_135981/g.236257  ORF Transcript_135981/g.236257 Transcript_135981/m.236257 type:complete len:99 (+) Transcript_135981:2948-3244(+)